jgi:hypothetical protein
MTTGRITSGTMGAAGRTLEGDDLHRRSDPQLFGLARKSVRCAVIVDVVALHGKLPWIPWISKERSVTVHS